MPNCALTTGDHLLFSQGLIFCILWILRGGGSLGRGIPYEPLLLDSFPPKSPPLVRDIWDRARRLQLPQLLLHLWVIYSFPHLAELQLPVLVFVLNAMLAATAAHRKMLPVPNGSAGPSRVSIPVGKPLSKGPAPCGTEGTDQGLPLNRPVRCWHGLEPSQRSGRREALTASI